MILKMLPLSILRMVSQVHGLFCPLYVDKRRLESTKRAQVVFVF